MTSLILHHYNASPFSEKIRLIFGYKQIRWQSVVMPSMLPKPTLTAITGGYRGAPVLQIGADVYIDSTLIANELDRRFPNPSLYPPGASPWALFIAGWADHWMFWKAARLMVGLGQDKFPAAFIADRMAMGGPLRAEKIAPAADIEHLISQLQIALLALERALTSSQHVASEVLSYADFALYHNLFFLQRMHPGLFDTKTFTHLRAWMQRMASLGQGERVEMSGDTALQVARESQPEPIVATENYSDPTGLNLGEQVAVRPESFGQEEARGALLDISLERIVVARTCEQLGNMNVHYPRLGYRVYRV